MSPANTLLAWERLERGWSQEDVVEQLNKLANAKTSELTPDYISRWENGRRRPEGRYRKLLVRLYGKTASELGLLTTEELAMRPTAEDLEAVSQRLVTIFNSPDLAPLFLRRTFLKGVVGAGMLTTLVPTPANLDASSLLAATTRPRGIGTAQADAYERVADGWQELYWDSSSQVAYQSAIAHTELGLTYLRNAKGTPPADLYNAVARTALLAARVAFFDLQHVAGAEQCFELARQLARLGDDPQLRAVIAGTRSCIPGFVGDLEAASSYIRSARAHLSRHRSPLLSSWLHCIASEAAARSGDFKGALRQIKIAEDELGGKGQDPLWLDFYSHARLAGFAGYAYLIAGESQRARDYLIEALETIGEHADKQRSVLLFDLATATASQDPAEALVIARSALDLLEDDFYRTGYDRIHQLRRALPDEAYRSRLEELSLDVAINWL